MTAETSGVGVKAAADRKVAVGGAAGDAGGSSNDQVDLAIALIAAGGMIGIITARGTAPQHHSCDWVVGPWGFYP